MIVSHGGSWAGYRSVRDLGAGKALCRRHPRQYAATWTLWDLALKIADLYLGIPPGKPSRPIPPNRPPP